MAFPSVVSPGGRGTLAQEMPAAYKDVADVMQVMDAADASKNVAPQPFLVIEG